MSRIERYWTALRQKGAFQSAAGVLRRLGLVRVGFRAYEHLVAFKEVKAQGGILGGRGVEMADGLPLPPADLRVIVAGTQDAQWFLGFGASMLETIRDVVKSRGVALEDLGAVLEFGCGCGRVLRHWPKVQGPKIYGTDYNPRLADWCRKNLLFATIGDNKAAPPLGYDNDSFDLIYAISVFTHLAADLQGPWLRELWRVTKPGGYVLITTHGDSFRSKLNAEEGAAYDRGELVTRFEEASGMNLCNAFHPDSYVRGPFSQGFSIEAFVGAGTRDQVHQDIWLLRKAV